MAWQTRCRKHWKKRLRESESPGYKVQRKGLTSKINGMKNWVGARKTDWQQKANVGKYVTTCNIQCRQAFMVMRAGMVTGAQIRDGQATNCIFLSSPLMKASYNGNNN